MSFSNAFATNVTNVTNVGVTSFFLSLPSLSLMLVVPSLTHVCQSKNAVRLTAYFLCVAVLSFNVLDGVSPCCWQNLITARVSFCLLTPFTTLDWIHRAIFKIRLRPYAFKQWCCILRLRHQIVARQFPGLLCTKHYWKQWWTTLNIGRNSKMMAAPWRRYHGFLIHD